MVEELRSHNLPGIEEAYREYKETGSKESKQNVVTIGQAMVHYFAGIYSPGRADEKLQQAAKSGFIKALNDYDPERGTLFSMYATHCIISSIRQELRNRDLFRIPEWIKDLQEDVIRATEELARQNEELPTLEDISGKLNIAEKGIAEAMLAGVVPVEQIDLSAFRSLRHETFKLPIEDVIKIRKSIDRLRDIQERFLSLISVNIKELTLAMDEEEKALNIDDTQYAKIVESFGAELEPEYLSGYKLAFPKHFSKDALLCFFEVLSDEFGLRLVDLNFLTEPKLCEGNKYSSCLEIVLEGRYRGLVELLDYMRNSEKALTVNRVVTERNQYIPARINTKITLDAIFASPGNNKLSPTRV